MQIKGINEGIFVKFRSTDWQGQCAELMTEISTRKDFFAGARISIDMGTISIHSAEMGKLRDDLLAAGLRLANIFSSSVSTRESAKLLGINAVSDQNILRSLTGKSPAAGANASYIDKDLNSGEVLKTKNHLIINGNVMPGAELISEGNIIVWGKLAGAVHAGSSGNEDAIICALHLTPTYAQIADAYLTPSRRKSSQKPEMLSLQEGKIIKTPWKGK